MVRTKLTVGWREWVALPALDIPAIKAKVDTGARTSTLHAFNLETFQTQDRLKVRFQLHPFQGRDDIIATCVADVVDSRIVSDSGGHRERRYVIRTLLALGEETWPIEITLTERDTMRFRMLLGRTAMEERLLVDPYASYLLGKPAAILLPPNCKALA